MNHRFNTLDGLRGVAAIAVMFFHFTQHTSLRLFSGAGLAVDLFFCLSGFVIAHSYQQRLIAGMSFKDFFLKRLVRLYPMFMIGLVLGASALLMKTAYGQTSLTFHETLSAIALNAFYIPYLGDFFVHVGKDRIDSALFPTNDPAWSLFFELVVNILFAFVVLRAGRRKNPLPWVLLGSITLIAYVLLTGFVAPGWSAPNIIGGLPRTVFGFFSGVYIYFLFDRISARCPRIRPTYLILATLFVFMFPTRFAEPTWLLVALILVPIVVALGTVSDPKPGMAHRIFDYLGWLSYPVYCIHYPIYSMFTSFTQNADARLWGACLCAVVTIALAHLSAKFIDEPFREMLSRRLFRPKPAPLGGAAIGQAAANQLPPNQL
ncbi:MAG: acyltransferase 3 [Rhodocyclales bacterium]|nr:acyltransferase 3 [Rhodocyclales bacterium]